MVKNLPANAGEVRDTGSIPGSGSGSGRCPGGENGNPLQYPCLGDPTDRGPRGGYSPAAATAKSLQSCPTLCDPIDGNPPGFPSLGFSRQEHWSGLPFPSPMHESEK